MTQFLAERLLLVLGVGFLVANLQVLAGLVRYWRVRGSALVIWPARRPANLRVFVLLAAALALVIVHSECVTLEVLLAGHVGAIAWDLITWWVGLPTSSSHALLGGFGGAALAHAGRWSGVLHPEKVLSTVEFIVIAPFLGLVLALVFLVILSWSLRRAHPGRVDRWFRLVQLGSAAAYSLGHGTNDAQKTMGIIAALLYASIWKSQQAAFDAGNVHFPFWIIVACNGAIALGTMAGGWKIVNTMGMRITKLRPIDGACAETAAAVSLFLSAKLGIPVSTTHTITGVNTGSRCSPRQIN